MTPDQVSGFFDAGEAFIEGTIAAALVVLWLLVVSLQLARPYMVGGVHKFSLRLGADLWWIIFVALRDLFLVQVFLGSFIFFYPDVVTGQPMPITGSLAAVLAFAALLLKLMTKGDANVRSVQAQTLLIGAGAALYLTAYVFGAQATELTGQHIPTISKWLTTNTNTDVALPLTYICTVAIGLLGIVAVAYNLRQTSVRRPRPAVEA